MIRMEGAKEESMRARDAMCKCLEGLQKAAKLCCLLGKFAIKFFPLYLFLTCKTVLPKSGFLACHSKPKIFLSISV